VEIKGATEVTEKQENLATVYLGIDGDRIGTKIEGLVIMGDLEAVTDLSERIKLALNKVEEIILSSGQRSRVIFSAGDSILAEMEFDRELCEGLIELFAEISGCTASAGIGRTPADAYLALKLAKSQGGARVLTFGELRGRTE
jgi:hypothetical protein